MKLEALYNAVIVKPYEGEETTYGNIIVPDLGNEKNKLYLHTLQEMFLITFLH